MIGKEFIYYLAGKYKIKQNNLIEKDLIPQQAAVYTNS